MKVLLMLLFSYMVFSQLLDGTNLVFSIDHNLHPITGSDSICTGAANCSISMCHAFDQPGASWIVLLPFFGNPCTNSTMSSFK